MFFISLIVVGLVIGALARLAVPGPDPMPLWATILLGIGGSAVGGIAAKLLLGTTGGILVSLVGAIVLLLLFRRFVEHRPITGPGSRARRR